MGAITDRQAAIVAELKAAGIRATADPRAVLAPCVQVGLPRLEPVVLGACAYDADWTLTVIGTATGGAESLQSLDTLLTQLLPVLGAFTQAVPITVQLTPGGDPSPAYTITWTEPLTWQ
jgi:hypothetical protein